MNQTSFVRGTTGGGAAVFVRGTTGGGAAPVEALVIVFLATFSSAFLVSCFTTGAGTLGLLPNMSLSESSDSPNPTELYSTLGVVSPFSGRQLPTLRPYPHRLRQKGDFLLFSLLCFIFFYLWFLFIPLSVPLSVLLLSPLLCPSCTFGSSVFATDPVPKISSSFSSGSVKKETAFRSRGISRRLGRRH